MLGAVIFDFDGVITDSEVLHLRAFNRMLGRFAIEISKEDYYRDYLGLTDLDLLATLAEKGLLKVPPEDIERLAKQKEEIFHRLVETGGTIIAGVRPFLRMLSENAVPMAICSGALLAEIELILEKARLRDFFEVIVSAEQVKRGKPHPDGFLLTLQRLNEESETGVQANECVVIEDSHWGLEAAKAAGMHTVAITNSYDAEQLSMAEKVINHLGELNMRDLEALCS
ncbi:MAG: HAD family hydrolase [Planctomycetota bacterium]|jgi:beta-phosphoglucomutase